MADYIAKGPTADEVQRAVMSEVSGRIRGLEQVGGFGGKAVSLAEGQTLRPRQRLLQEDARLLRRDHAGGGARGDAAMAHAAGADDHAFARRARRLIRRPRRSSRPRPRPTRARARSRATGRFRRSASSPRSTSRHRPHRLSNGIPVEYVAAHGRAGDPGRDVVRRRGAADSPHARGLAVDDHGLLDEGTVGADVAASSRRRRSGSARTSAPATRPTGPM